MDAKTIKIKPLSINDAWQGKRYKTPEYKKFERDVSLQLRSCKIPTGPLEIYLEWGFSNSGSDWDNPIKPFVDILQKKYGFNDNRIQLGHVKKTKVKKGEEFIKFHIETYKVKIKEL